MAGVRKPPPDGDNGAATGNTPDINDQGRTLPAEQVDVVVNSDSLRGWGLPPDLATKANEMLAAGASIDEILAYIRGSTWYAQTYVGIAAGISNGVIGNEADYRSYLNQANQLFRRYYGRDITTDEMASFLTQGVGLGSINEQLRTGALFQTTFGQPIDPSQLTQVLGSGVDPEQMFQIQAAYQQLFGAGPTPQDVSTFLKSGQSLGYLKQANDLFQEYLGRGISPFELAGLLNGGVDLNTLAKQFQGGAYIGAYGSDIQGAMTQYGTGRVSTDELRILGEQKSGYATPMGFKLQRALDQAVQRMQGVFHGSLGSPAGLNIGPLGLSAPRSTAPPDVGA